MSAELTEALILAWLRDQIATIGIKGLELTINSGGQPVSASVPQGPLSTYIRDYGFGDTILVALAEMKRAHQGPAERAARLRAQADAIETEANP